MSAQEDFAAAYSTLVQALEESADRPGLGAKAAQAYAAVVQENEALRGHEATAAAAKAFSNYEEVVRSGFLSTEARSLARAAYSRYLASIKSAWGSVDESTVDPATLSTIAQSMLGAAWLLGRSADAQAEQEIPAQPVPEAPAATRQWGRASFLPKAAALEEKLPASGSQGATP